MAYIHTHFDDLDFDLGFENVTKALAVSVTKVLAESPKTAQHHLNHTSWNYYSINIMTSSMSIPPALLFVDTLVLTHTV